MRRCSAGLLTWLNTGYRAAKSGGLGHAFQLASVIRQPQTLVALTRQRHDQSVPDPDEAIPSEGQTANRYLDTDQEFAALSEEYPQLKEYDPAAIISFLEFMTNYGFSSNKSVEMVLRFPSILSTYESLIPRAIDVWRSLGFDENERARILYRHPQLVEYPMSKTRTRYSFLSSFLSRKEVIEAISSSVQIVLDSEPVVEKKLNYLIKSVCHKAPAIVKSKTLSYSFLHIRTRHEFLIRAGLFVPVSYYKLHKQTFTKDPSVIRDKYYSPADIVCTHDKEFIRKCTKGLLTLNELASFEEMYKTEYEKSDDDELSGNYGTNGRNIDENYEEDSDASHSTEYFNKKDSTEFYF